MDILVFVDGLFIDPISWCGICLISILLGVLSKDDKKQYELNKLYIYKGKAYRMIELIPVCTFFLALIVFSFIFEFFGVLVIILLPILSFMYSYIYHNLGMKICSVCIVAITAISTSIKVLFFSSYSIDYILMNSLIYLSVFVCDNFICGLSYKQSSKILSIFKIVTELLAWSIFARNLQELLYEQNNTHFNTILLTVVFYVCFASGILLSILFYDMIKKYYKRRGLVILNSPAILSYLIDYFCIKEKDVFGCTFYHIKTKEYTHCFDFAAKCSKELDGVKEKMSPDKFSEMISKSTNEFEEKYNTDNSDEITSNDKWWTI